MTGWTWDYVRNAITFKRYDSLKKTWQQMPPLAITAFAIARALGMEQKGAPGEASGGEVYYDESYYEDTANTPHRSGAAGALTEAFHEAGGEVAK